jgi:hypothetical protein
MAVPQKKGDRGSQQQAVRRVSVDRGDDKTNRKAANDAAYSIWRVGTDRSDLHPDIKNRGNTRNVRVSTMPGNSQQGDFSTHSTTDKQFRAEYAKKGLQPSSLRDKQTRQTYEPIEQIGSDVMTKEELEQEMAEQQAMEQGMIDQSNESSTSVPPPSAAKSPDNEAAFKAKRKLSRLKAKGLNKAFLSTGLFVWLIFQVPIALLGTIVFLVAAAVGGILDEVSTVDPDDSFFTIAGKTIAKATVTVVGGALGYANKLIDNVFGVDLSSVADAFFGAIYIVLMGYAIILLFTIYLVYKMASLHPLSGEKAGLKIGVFILAIVGYSVPILNLFPWFLAWTSVVGRWPK